MLKFNELTKQDKEKRYNQFMQLLNGLGIFLILFTDFSSYSLILIPYFIVTLYLFGYLNKEVEYDLSHFFLDALLVTITGFFVNYLLVPNLLKVLLARYVQIQQNSWEPLIQGLVSVLFIYLLWYGLIYLEEKWASKSLQWKKDLTSFLSNKKREFY